jgi:hypothetical protein
MPNPEIQSPKFAFLASGLSDTPATWRSLSEVVLRVVRDAEVKSAAAACARTERELPKAA